MAAIVPDAVSPRSLAPTLAERPAPADSSEPRESTHPPFGRVELWSRPIAEAPAVPPRQSVRAAESAAGRWRRLASGPPQFEPLAGGGPGRPVPACPPPPG